MRKILVSDNSLKIISVVVSIIIWVYIAIVMDPAIEITVRDLPIQFIGQESLSSKELAVISESATSVTVKIKGSRKKMGNNDMKSIIAKADVSTIQKIGVHSIPVEVVVPFENQGISSQSLYAVDIKIEKMAYKEIGVEVKTTGTLAQSYMSGDITVKPNKVTIKGPESAIEKVAKAVVKLDYDGEDVDIDTTLPLFYYSEDDKEMTAADAILKRIVSSSGEADVHCPVLKIREISPTADFGSQTLPENFEYKIEPSILYVYGEDAGADKVSEIKTAVIPLNKLLDNDKVKVKLIIPHGAKILYDVSEVEIEVKK